MFTQECFIRKCTSELKYKLEMIGYHRRPIKEKYDSHKFLLVYRDGCYNSCTGNETGLEYYIDCGENEDLFLAIAALRDDSDLHQYFILDRNISCASENFKPKGTFILCNRNTWFRDFNKDGNVDMFSSANIPAHKATLEELIEHFK